MASKAVGLLTFNFGANMEGFNRAMNKAQKKLKKFGRSMTSAGKSMTMGLTLPILGLATAALKFGSDLEETNAKFLTVFSSMQAEAEETAKVFKDSFGLSELAAKDMLSGTGDLLVGIGLTEEKSLDLSTKINQLAVDLASFTNFSGGAKGASDALTSALLGEREALKSLGISIKESDLKEFAADQGLVWKELDKGTRAQLTYELAAQQSQKAIGDFERTSGSFANQMRIVKGDLVDVASEMGSRLIPHAKVAIEKLKGLIKWFDGLSDSQKDNIIKWGLILAAIGPVLIIIGKMSIGISALIPVMARLGTFLLANPYLLLAAAVVAFGIAVTKVTKALWGKYDAQKSVNDLDREAGKRIAGDITKIESLTRVLNKETSSLDDKKKALDTLKELYPDYYKELDETTFSSDTLAQSTDALKKELMDLARIDVYRKKLEEINESLIDLELREGKPETMTKAVLLPLGTGFEVLNAIIRKTTSGNKDLKKSLQTKIDINQFKNLNIEKEHLLELLDELEEKYPEEKKEIERVSHAVRELKDETGDLTEDTEELSNGYDGLVNMFQKLRDRMTGSMSPIENQFKGIVFWQTQMTDQQKLVNAGYELFGDVLTSSLDGALDSQENFFKLFIKNIKRAIRSLIIQLAVMTLIKALMGGGKGAFSLASITGNLKEIMNIPTAADGLLATGPTTALIGEGRGTSMANPEVVAPLDRLKSLMGGTEQNITVTGKLVGNDIFLSNAKTGVNRLRTV